MAVEFALIVPLLIGLILGIVEFGRIYNAQVLMTNAAREAARTLAVTTNKHDDAVAAANSVAPGYVLSVNVPPSCTAGSEVNATVTTTFNTISGSWFHLNSQVTVAGTGAMRCAG